MITIAAVLLGALFAILEAYTGHRKNWKAAIPVVILLFGCVVPGYWASNEWNQRFTFPLVYANVSTVLACIVVEALRNKFRHTQADPAGSKQRGPAE